MTENTVTDLFSNEKNDTRAGAFRKVLANCLLPWRRCGCGCSALTMHIGNTLTYTLYYKRGSGFSLYTGHVEGEKCVIEHALYAEIEEYVVVYGQQRLIDEIERSHKGLARLVWARSLLGQR